MVKKISLCTSLSLGKPSYLSKDRGPLLGQGILSSNGAIWAHQRKIIAPELYIDKVKVNFTYYRQCNPLQRHNLKPFFYYFLFFIFVFNQLTWNQFCHFFWDSPVLTILICHFTWTKLRNNPKAQYCLSFLIVSQDCVILLLIQCLIILSFRLISHYYTII